MATATTVVIVRPEHLAAVRKRLADADGLAVISETDSIAVHDQLVKQPPESVIIHSTFATTSRGATLVAGLKSSGRADANIVRVFIEDEDKTPLVLSETTLAGARALQETSRPLDRAGTRQAARYPMQRRQVVVNGEAGQLVDLSVSGAQVQAPMRLRPSQLVRVILLDDSGDARCQATVAWSIAVPSGGTIHYRAGIEFVAPDAPRLTKYCSKFGGPPDPTLAAR